MEHLEESACLELVLVKAEEEELLPILDLFALLLEVVTLHILPQAYSTLLAGC